MEVRYQGSLDLSKWALIGFKDESGLGRMATDFRSLLPSVNFFVMPSRRLEGNPLESGEEHFDPDWSDSEVIRAIEDLQGVIFFESFPHPSILRLAKTLGILTICVPMWEWFQSSIPDWNLCTTFFCPNQACITCLRKLGFRNTQYVPWPVNLAGLPERKVSGPAKVFIHNAGVYESDDRKSTEITLNAFERVQNDEIRLLIRSQNFVPFTTADSRVEFRTGNLQNYSDLYSEGDVAIQVSKAEGLGFGILEPMACGMPVITTNYAPMNEYVRQSPMLVGTRFGKSPAIQTSYIRQAHLKTPRISRLSKAIKWCAANDLRSVSQDNRQWAVANFNRDSLSRRWISAMESLVAN